MLRPYQEVSAKAGLTCLQTGKSGIIVLPTGSGKSHVVAAMSQAIKGRLIVLQPSKEILEQNYAKLQAVGELDIGIWSASCGIKQGGRITLATIGSVVRHKELFADCECVIVDECHAVNSKGGMYESFITSLNLPTIGLTATPYRLKNYNDFRTGRHVAESRILTRTRPRIFKSINHVTQVADLIGAGFLSSCRYERDENYHEKEIKVNSTGQGYDDRALASYNEQHGLTRTIVRHVTQSRAQHILIFCKFLAESEQVMQALRAVGVSATTVDGKTPKVKREAILSSFRSGFTRVVINVGVLTTGFDFPALDCIILACPTKSVARYYQMIGRGVRVCDGKITCQVVDLCDNLSRFGRIETFHLEDPTGRQLWRLCSDAGQLTGVDISTKTVLEHTPVPVVVGDASETIITFGKHRGVAVKEIPLDYLEWACAKFNRGKWKTLFRGEIKRRKLVLQEASA